MSFNLEQTINMLERTPSVLSQLLSNLPEGWAHQNEGENTWSPFDIVGHFIHGEQTDWIPRSKIILEASESKKFEDFDRFAQFEASKGKNIHQLLDQFQQLRMQNLETLRSWSLGEEQLELTGIHPEFGAVTLKQMLATWLVHDLSHLNQITRVLVKNYKEEIGPWKNYLSLLNKE